MPSPKELPKPLRAVKDYMLNGVERTPQFEAMFTDTRIIPTTWGNLAAQIVESGLIDPQPDAVCEFLGLEPEELRSPKLQLQSSWELDSFEAQFNNNWRKIHVPKLIEGNTPFMTHMKEFEAAHEVADGAEQAHEIHQENLKRTQGKMVHEKTDEERAESGVMCKKRDALYTGTAITLDEYVKAVFNYDGEAVFSPQELASALGKLLEYIARNYFGYAMPNVPCQDIILGKDDTEYFEGIMLSLAESKASAEAREQWTQLLPFMIAPPPEEHFIFKGGEK